MNSNKFAKRNNFITSSEIREILKVTQQPEIISFAGGLPAPELFPVKEIKKACMEVLENNGEAALQYSTTEGYVPLREAICKRMGNLQIQTSIDNILMISGSQQALDLMGKAFIDEGDTVICESPTYLAAINAFKTYMPKFKGVSMDEQGMIMEELEDVLKSTPNAKFIYTIPDFQNPTGRTMALERRKRMVELANKYDVVILEDNPYGEIRFAGEKLPSIKHFDTEGRVVYLSTFSKIFAPGLRLGWMCADKDIMEKLVPLKQNADLHTDIFAQMITSKYLEMFNIDEHIEKIREIYKHRRQVMVDAMNKYFPKNIKHTLPDGGLFLWVMLPDGMDCQVIFDKAIANNVAFVPGTPFFPNRDHKNQFRLNYSNMTDDRIVEGIKRLGKVIASENI
ncbi:MULTISPECIES: PLP-dependent aminotransferase family protein [Clostridium]|uniref:aminotransferase-like domain-containing protein n=1 Tax=Clostridium TaxID=1485 RepID=UPI0008265270|nr:MULTISPECIES: PLP-dependent aminotransferase family protein [Clostridium]PJI08432.1 PLP-dependent aminotransferase family protein [Clostridium sp. CT7]